MFFFFTNIAAMNFPLLWIFHENRNAPLRAYEYIQTWWFQQVAGIRLQGSRTYLSKGGRSKFEISVYLFKRERGELLVSCSYTIN